MSKIEDDRAVRHRRSSEHAERILVVLPCPVCGDHDWFAPPGGAAWCGGCNLRLNLRPGTSEGWIAEFWSDDCWEHTHIERIPEYDGERKGHAKFLGMGGLEWISARAATMGDAETVRWSWERDPHVPHPWTVSSSLRK